MIGFVGTVFPAMVKRIFKVNRRSFGRTRIRRNIDLFIGFVRVADIFYGFINGCFDSMDFCVCHALEWKQNRPDLWGKYKNNIYSICRKPENKVRMVFQTGKNGILKNSYFRYYNADFEHKGEGSEESYRHELFKECISRIERLEIRWKGEALTIYILERTFLILRQSNRKR